MHSTWIAPALTGLLVLGAVVFRVLWLGSSAASAAALGRLPFLPRGLRRWLLGDRPEVRNR